MLAGLVKIVHQPELLASSWGRNDVIARPRVGMTHSRQITTMAILTQIDARVVGSCMRLRAARLPTAVDSLGIWTGATVWLRVIGRPPQRGTAGSGRRGSAT